MASPVGAPWRNSYAGPSWGDLVRQVTVLQAAIEGHESSYEPTNFANLTSSLQEAVDALNAAAAADQDSGNNGYPS